MASIIKRGKTYSVVYYEGKGKNKQQIWESGLSYTTAKSRKAQIEHEQQKISYPRQELCQQYKREKP